MVYIPSSHLIAPAPKLAALGVEEVVATKSLLKLNTKQLSELREVLRLSIGNHADKFSEEDLDDLGMTFLEATAIALKRKALLATQKKL